MKGMVHMDNIYSNNGYQRIFNNAGIHSLDRGINIPDAALGIGFADFQAPVPISHYSPTQPAIQHATITAIEQTKLKGQGNPISTGTFQMGAYMGEALGGF